MEKVEQLGSSEEMRNEMEMEVEEPSPQQPLIFLGTCTSVEHGKVDEIKFDLCNSEETTCLCEHCGDTFAGMCSLTLHQVLLHHSISCSTSEQGADDSTKETLVDPPAPPTFPNGVTSHVSLERHPMGRDRLIKELKKLLQLKVGGVEAGMKAHLDRWEQILMYSLISWLRVDEQEHLVGRDLPNDGNTIAHELCPLSTAEEYHIFVEMVIARGKGSIFSVKNHLGETAILYAFKTITNLLPETISLLAASCRFDWNAVNRKGSAVLHVAAVAGSRQVLERIVQYGGDWTLRNNDGYSVLHCAALGGNAEALNYFLSFTPAEWVDERNVQGYTPLHLIVWAGTNMTAAFTSLQRAGADVNAVDPFGNSLLHIAAARGKSKEELEVIVTHGAKWRLLDRSGQSVVHLLAEAGNAQALEYFLQLGANPNAKNYHQDETPLLRVRYSWNNLIETVQVLVRYGANVNAKDRNKNNLLMVAVSNNRSLAELKTLVDIGADWKARNAFEEDILAIAQRSGHNAAFKYFQAKRKKAAKALARRKRSRDKPT